MRFEKTLRQSVYGPWKDKYLDYGKLKSLLREESEDDDENPWTSHDETRFSDELFNAQLEKVGQFQEEQVGQLRAQVDAAMDKLREIVPNDEGAPSNEAVPKNEGAKATSETTTKRLKLLEAELDAITNRLKELRKYSNLNYTGFLKIVKKHDRKRGHMYRIGPMMRLLLSKKTFASEQGYSPLLNKLSLLYFAIRQKVEEEHATDLPAVELDGPAEIRNGERYVAHKFWVHPDNLMEVKAIILRRLPALIYSKHDSEDRIMHEDPTITSLYLDNAQFELYAKKIERDAEASSVRLRWFGQLAQKPEVFVEQKIIHVHGESEERKVTLKEKYVKAFLDSEYNMEKTIQKMEQRQGQSPEAVDAFKATASGIQDTIKSHRLEPVLRATYVRAAFQRPGDSRVRISIDTEIAFIREDTLDPARPCRQPNEWHRTDVDNSQMTYPFKNINQSEVSRFPYAVLEIKLKEDGGRRAPTWIEELKISHLVHPAPRFSKFVHGVAVLFEENDHVNPLPFWLGDLEGDIRKDPVVAFEEEEQRRAQRAEDEMAVGSVLGNKMGSSYKPSTCSPVGKSYLAERAAAESAGSSSARSPGFQTSDRHLNDNGENTIITGDQGVLPGDEVEQPTERRAYGTFSSVFPSFSLSKFSRARRARKDQQLLPPGVVEPVEWMKNDGPLKIEPKVWLANERTFVKWQNISLLLGGLAVSLYTAASSSPGFGSDIAAGMGVVFLAIATFTGWWGLRMYRVRRALIMQRSGKDFDNMIGPMVISVALMLALVLNFALVYRRAFGNTVSDGNGSVMPRPSPESVVDI